MPQKPESRLKQDVLHALKQLNRVWVVKIQQVAIRGTPDLLLCVNGTFVAIELKSRTGKLDQLQKYNLGQIRKAGGVSLVLDPDNFDECLDIIEAISLGYTVKVPVEEVPEPWRN